MLQVDGINSLNGTVFGLAWVGCATFLGKSGRILRVGR